jgi:hypothetical protein
MEAASGRVSAEAERVTRARFRLSGPEECRKRMIRHRPDCRFYQYKSAGLLHSISMWTTVMLFDGSASGFIEGAWTRSTASPFLAVEPCDDSELIL